MKAILFLVLGAAVTASALACSDNNDRAPTTQTPAATMVVATATPPPAPPTQAPAATATAAPQACAGSFLLTHSNSSEVSLVTFKGPRIETNTVVGDGWIMPALSPDGSRVAYYSLRPSFGLYAADISGQNQRRLADVMQLHYQNQPVWSARGDRIAFESARSGGQGAPADIFVANADGSGLVNVTKGAVSAYGPTWSADGARLAFTVWEADGVTSNIYSAAADGSGLQRVTNNPPGMGSWSGSWSPDGSLIAFISSRDGNGEVYVIRPDGSGLTNLTKSPSGDFASPIGSPPLAWAADGKKIAFLSDRHGNPELFSITTDGATTVRLTSDPGDETSPRWSSDGRCLTFYSSKPSPTGGLSVVYVNADGTGFTQLTTVR